MIGDVLTSSILCEALKNRYLKSEIHYLINSHTAAVLENNPFIDKQVLFTPEMEESLSLRNGLKKALKNEKYDVVIDVYSKLGSAEITKATAAQLRVGYKKWYTKWAYTHHFTYDKSPKTQAGLAIENRMKLLAPLKENFPAFLKPKIYLTTTEKSLALEQLQNASIQVDKPLLMISLLGSSEDKTYPLAYMAKILDNVVANHKAQLILNYIPKQLDQVNQLLALVQDDTRASIFDKVYGKSLREFLALTSHCHAMIGNEGGAINMAKALEIPTFSIFSPWITREAWDLFGNELNASFHLKDVQPHIYSNHTIKQLRKDKDSMYLKMHPSEIIGKIDTFLSRNLSF